MSATESSGVCVPWIGINHGVNVDFQRRFQMKLAQCTARGFSVSECFAFLWQETWEEVNAMAITSMQVRRGVPTR